MSGMPEGTRLQINDTVDASNLLPVIAPQQMYSFRYMHHVQGWEFRTVQGKGLWMPVIKRFALMPGVNGIKAGRGGAVAAVAHRKADGWTFFKLNAPVLCTVDGKLEQSIGYVQTFKTRNPNRVCYSDVWSCPYIIDSRTVDWASHYDAKGHDATLLLWMELGLIKAPNFANVSTRIKVQGRRSRRRAKLALTGTPAAMDAKVLEDDKLEAMEVAAPAAQGRRAAIATRIVSTPAQPAAPAQPTPTLTPDDALEAGVEGPVAAMQRILANQTDTNANA